MAPVAQEYQCLGLGRYLDKGSKGRKFEWYSEMAFGD
jgi:hypothetical protein